jgi:hypothetical protein
MHVAADTFLDFSGKGLSIPDRKKQQADAPS